MPTSFPELHSSREEGQGLKSSIMRIVLFHIIALATSVIIAVIVVKLRDWIERRRLQDLPTRDLSSQQDSRLSVSYGPPPKTPSLHSRDNDSVAAPKL